MLSWSPILTFEGKCLFGERVSHAAFTLLIPPCVHVCPSVPVLVRSPTQTSRPLNASAETMVQAGPCL